MLIKFQSEINLVTGTTVVNVEASVFPKKVFEDPTCGIKPGSVIISIYDVKGHHILERVPRDIEYRLATEAIEQARKSPLFQKIQSPEIPIATR